MWLMLHPRPNYNKNKSDMVHKERTQGKRNRQYILNYGSNFDKDY